MLEHRDNDALNYQFLKEYSNKNSINEMYNEIILKNDEFVAIRSINNMGTTYRNIIKEMNIIPKNASDNTIVFSGYTGPTFLIDFDNKIIIVIMCNIVHCNSLTRKERRKIEINLIDECYNMFIKTSI